MPVQFRDYYETLGVPKTATEDEIRTAFRKLARKHHPDVAKDKKAAEEKFKEINEAYEVLSDSEKRKKYDQLGADWNRPGGFQPPRGWGAQPPEGGFYQWGGDGGVQFEFGGTGPRRHRRSEEHTSELPSLTNLVCRLTAETSRTDQ